jgi:hypothetical protein
MRGLISLADTSARRKKKHGIVFWIMVRSGQHCSGSEMMNEE